MRLLFLLVFLNISNIAEGCRLWPSNDIRAESYGGTCIRFNNLSARFNGCGVQFLDLLRKLTGRVNALGRV